jgi:hypothetical protein
MHIEAAQEHTPGWPSSRGTEGHEEGRGGVGCSGRGGVERGDRGGVEELNIPAL